MCDVKQFTGGRNIGKIDGVLYTLIRLSLATDTALLQNMNSMNSKLHTSGFNNSSSITHSMCLLLIMFCSTDILTKLHQIQIPWWFKLESWVCGVDRRRERESILAVHRSIHNPIKHVFVYKHFCIVQIESWQLFPRNIFLGINVITQVYITCPRKMSVDCTVRNNESDFVGK